MMLSFTISVNDISCDAQCFILYILSYRYLRHHSSLLEPVEAPAVTPLAIYRMKYCTLYHRQLVSFIVLGFYVYVLGRSAGHRVRKFLR